jgi:hypothetical protein
VDGAGGGVSHVFFEVGSVRFVVDRRVVKVVLLII